MKKLLFLMCVFVWLLTEIMGQDKVSSVDCENLAKEFVSLLAQENFEKARNQFDDTMKSLVSTKNLETIWKSIIKQLGDYQYIESTRIETKNQYKIVFVTCQFKSQYIDIKVVLDATNKIAGLFFVPTSQAHKYHIPDYAKPSLFQESDVTFGIEGWTLPGILTLPTGKGPFPVLVLVHGSGPNDKDETIGPNKPFRDLAWGLASRGIAVLRYEKRTRQYGSKIVKMREGFTVKEETVIDAIEAVSFLQKKEGIDVNKIFILGHSLGGMLAPQIAKDMPNIAGLIILAGAARPLEDLILEQISYQASLSGSLSLDDKNKIEEIKRQVAAVKNISKDTPESDLPLGLPLSYWLDLKDYKPAVLAKELKQPMLILQGEEDCQVRMADFAEWKEKLSSRPDVTFKIYPKLNHLFMEVEGQSTGAEYEQVNNIAEIVIKDIAEWISHQPLD